MTVEHRFRALRMGNHGSQPGFLRVRRERDEHVRRTGERHFHQDAVGPFERVAAGVLVEQCVRRRQLPSETKLDRRTVTDALEGRADFVLARGRQRELGPDMRRREEEPRSVFGRVAAERHACRDVLGTVVAGWDDVRVTVDEAAVHTPTVATGSV